MADTPLSLPATPDDAFYREILRGLSAPITPNTLGLLYAWRQTEGGSATYNPFNTTLKVTGSTPYSTNRAGVQNYPDARVGVDATVRTLLDSRYAEIVRLLRGNAVPTTVAQAIIASRWGTGKLLLDVLGMYARGKVVVAPIATVPGALPISSVEPTLTKAPRELPQRRKAKRTSVWLWVGAGSLLVGGIALFIVLSRQRKVGTRAV